MVDAGVIFEGLRLSPFVYFEEGLSEYCKLLLDFDEKKGSGLALKFLSNFLAPSS